MDFETLKAVPEDIRANCRYYGNLEGRVFFASNYIIDVSGVLKLSGMIMDSSERAHGIVLKEQWSLVEFFACSAQSKWSLRTIGPEERP